MSLTVIKNIICELTGYRPGTVDVSQGDRGSRAVSCRLMENGAAWMIPEGATARVAYTLPDGTEGLYDRRPDGSPMWEISKNTVTVELADQLMAQAGMVQMSILVIGPEGGQLATWPIRVMVIADSPARLTVPEEMPPYGAGFAGKIFFGGEDGIVTPLGIGDGVEIVRQEDGTFVLIAYGGSSGGIAEEKDPSVPEWAKQPQKPPYTAEEVGALSKDTKIPGKTSDLTNDSGFVTKAVSDLTNYYTRAQTQELIAAIPRFRVTVVQQLPAAGEDLVLYLVPFATAEGQYLEYIWVDGRWEIIGSQRVDLTGYATEVWVKDYVAEHSGQNVDLTAVQTILRNVMTIIRAQVEDADGTPQAYSMDISRLAAECDTLIAGLAGSGGETPDEPEQPAKTLTGISATYSGGDVAAGTAVSALTGVVVTAHYSDGTSEAVSGYTLSGEITAGENTVTVSYGGKTATFSVTGIAESSGLPHYEYTVVGTGILTDTGAATPSSLYNVTDFIDIDPNYSALSVATYMDAASDARISSSTYVQWFNSDTFLSRTGGSPVIAIGDTKCTKPVTHTMPEGATKFRICVQNNCDRFMLYKGTVSSSDI